MNWMIWVSVSPIATLPHSTCCLLVWLGSLSDIFFYYVIHIHPIQVAFVSLQLSLHLHECEPQFLAPFAHLHTIPKLFVCARCGLRCCMALHVLCGAVQCLSDAASLIVAHTHAHAVVVNACTHSILQIDRLYRTHVGSERRVNMYMAFYNKIFLNIDVR